eukprot:CAMPEP_0183472084 /NCGR_PEP_ID=MMETSP0370-20130417/158936_1 /TAXON_ID=268820 /ORGANISM="Peridinium aciculiferum, Strain PAER-2" /LENGTH=55 /DNA_ID=CAMNT_0025664705 /DNA_START=180 /DNA_END=343 /DNA_ORIENTATION=-
MSPRGTPSSIWPGASPPSEAGRRLGTTAGDTRCPGAAPRSESGGSSPVSAATASP